ncbi:hypothetical protein F5Y19DRAFT_470737 [Xylariaceae sp. FL1651]|nr:hypothetical protein F5Y19DRAFT_470737 [Xylariaceae sp. FL1651]
MFKVRRSAKVFYIRVLLSQLVSSLITEEKYLSYLEISRSDEQAIGEIFNTDVFGGAVRTFKSAICSDDPFE